MDFNFQGYQVLTLGLTALAVWAYLKAIKKGQSIVALIVATVMLILTFASPFRFKQEGMAGIEALLTAPQFETTERVLVELPDFEAHQAEKMATLKQQSKDTEPL